MRELHRVAVITGASSGIGLAAAKALASEGWRVIALGRDPGRTAAAEVEIRAAGGPGVQLDMIRANLALMTEAVRASNEIAAKTDRIDVLLNNAGGTAKEKVVTSEGNEVTFAANHLGHFVLTNRLLPLLRTASTDARPGATRIINVSSSAHEHSPGLNWDDLQMLENFVPIVAYCNAKLANVLFTRALAKRLTGRGIVVHAMHPGAVSTNFVNHADPATQEWYRARDDLLSAEEGADTLVWLATATEPGDSSGEYYYQRKIAPASPAANDMHAAERLWLESEKLVATSINQEWHSSGAPLKHDEMGG
jgi:NAD(P)-dependent dehydrogenase (short-subunit alcohol dehydrogenase family)